MPSARAVKCTVKSGNERNPRRVLNVHARLPTQVGGRGGRRQISMALTSRATHMKQWEVQWVAKPRGGANPIKTGLSSDCRLELACMKSELLVIAYQHVAVNTFSGLVHTACQVTEVALARSLTLVGRKSGGRPGLSHNKVAVGESAAGLPPF